MSKEGEAPHLPRFVAGEISDIGADHPVVNGILLQFNHILQTNLIELSPESVVEVTELLFRCMFDLLDVEQSVTNYCKCEDTALSVIAVTAPSEKPVGLYKFMDPSRDLVRYFEDYLMRSVIVLRDIKHLGDVILGQSYRDLRYLRQALTELLTEEHPYVVMMQKAASWIDRLYYLRGQAEHAEPDIDPFDVLHFQHTTPVVRLPTLRDDGVRVRDYIGETTQKLRVFAEEMIAVLLDLRSAEGFRVVSLPQGVRSGHGYRYAIDLVEERKQQLPASMDTPPQGVSSAERPSGTGGERPEEIRDLVAYKSGLAVITTRRMMFLTERDAQTQGGWIDLF